MKILYLLALIISTGQICASHETMVSNLSAGAKALSQTYKTMASGWVIGVNSDFKKALIEI